MARNKVYPYTLEEARERLVMYKQCEKELVSGQAKAYKVGSREFTAIDLPWLTKEIQKFANMVADLSGTRGRIRVKRVVFRD